MDVAVSGDDLRDRAAGHLAEGLPGLADPGWPAGKMIAEAARFGDEEQRDHVAWGWLAGREPAAAAREILTAAEEMSPLLRSVAVGVVERLGDDAVPAWRDMAAARCVGPHARAVLAAWDQGPEPSEADWEWREVEAAAAALEDRGPDEALTRVWESMPGADLDGRLAAVRATGHPDMTSGPPGSTRSRWRRRSPVTLARTIRSAWRSGATPRSSTGPRTTRPNRSRSAWPRSIASWLLSAAKRSDRS
ncbi:MAG TPA: hypothetical protein VGS06_16875 [Streptosporangiaceae bacterium]|nr:hypothetical protein [Streptosporangiaceae bacterium]